MNTIELQQQEGQQVAGDGQHVGGGEGPQPGSATSPESLGTNQTIISNVSTFGPENVESWDYTVVKQETFAFLWTLKGYSVLASRNDEIKSPTFRGNTNCPYSWRLYLIPMKKVNDQECSVIGLNRLRDLDSPPGGVNSQPWKVRSEIRLFYGDGTIVINECGQQNNVWGYDTKVTSDLMEQGRRMVSSEDTLKIHCRIWIEGELKHKSGLGGSSADDIKMPQFELLSNNLKELLIDTSFADLEVATKTKTFMVHKAILAARSSVFKTMFQTRIVESANNRVHITDFDAGVVKAMLEYMYTGETASLNEKAADLIQIAEKYDLGVLKADCEDSIFYNLTVENCSEILVLAHLHNAPTLKRKVIGFINWNKDDVRKTPNFQRIMVTNPEVFVDLYLSQF